ncbi:MAG: hypothetical protein LBH69_04115, partial [Methanomassiliicoccaceae archaeon]|nr:hypothetical protein [Methanomassiliicoccaceae archaeon]
MRKESGRMADRIDSFILNPDAGALTGERRMGPVPLLDMLADRLSEDDTANIIRVTESDDAVSFIKSGIRSDKKNHVIIYADVDVRDTDSIIAEHPNV